MKKEIISDNQGISIMTLFIIGSTLVLGGGKKASQDAWIAALLSMIMAVPLLIIYARLLSLFPSKNLFEIIEKIFGKILGKIIILIFTLYFFHLGALVIRSIIEFVQIVSFPETPKFFIVLPIGVLIILMVKNGIEVLGRLSKPILMFILFTAFFTITLSIPKMNLDNIKPILYKGWKPILENGFSLLTFPFAETISFTVILDSLNQKNRPYKVYMLSLIIGGAFILLVSLRNILVLSVPNMLNHYFPAHSAIALIQIGDFLERIEIISVAAYLMTTYIKICVCLFATCLGVSRLFNFNDYTKIAAPIAFLMLNLSLIIYSGAMEMFEWVDIYPYYAIPFQIILPLLIWIFAEIKNKSKIPSKG